MAVRPKPKIFGEIKTSWRMWLLSFSGSWSGFVQAQVMELQEAGVGGWKLLAFWG